MEFSPSKNQFSRLIERDLPKFHVPYNSIVSFLEAYSSKDWKTYSSFLSDKEIERRIESLIEEENNISLQNLTKEKYIKEILPKEMLSENLKLIGFDFVKEEKLNNRKLSYHFKLEFLNEETENTFFQNTKFILLPMSTIKDGKKEIVWRVDKEEEVITNRFLSALNKLVNYFIKEEVCCVV